jgi:hypothetical protein
MTNDQPTRFTREAAQQIQETVSRQRGALRPDRVFVPPAAPHGDVSGGVDNLYGTAAADYSSGTTISLTSCDANGVADGVGAVTVTIPTSWGTVDLLSADVGGATTTVTCKIASGTLLQYAYAADGTAYLLGLPPTVVEFLRYDNSTYKLQQRVRWLFGTNVSTLSDWIDFAQSEESLKTSCTTPGS